MKLSTAISYRFKYQFKSIAFFLAYFSLFAIGFPLVGILLTNSTGQVNSDAIFSSFVFVIIIAVIGVSSDFKLFIQNGMSRNNIFLSYLISNAAVSFLLSGILVTFKIIANDFLMQNFKITLFLSELYASNNMWINFEFMFLFFLLGSSIGSVFGIFNDRVKGYKKILILASIVIIPIVFSIIIQLSSLEIKLDILDFFKSILGISDTGFSILPVSITMIILVLTLTVITYLMNYKREIRRVND